MVEFSEEELPDLDLEKKVEAAEERKLSIVRRRDRETALRRGRAYGEDEVRSRGETGVGAEQRVARAIAYAAWEYDGKPVGYGDRYEKEFGVKRIAASAGVTRGGTDLKNGKREK